MTSEEMVQARVIARIREFIDEDVVPKESILDQEDPAAVECMADLQGRAKSRGLWALGHPREIGGGGVSFMEFVYLNEAVGRSRWGQMAVGTVSTQDSLMLYRFGTDGQRSRWLPRLVAGEIYPSVALTEPDVAGSDPTLIETRAEPDGDHWVINGTKWFVSGADRAAFATVFCRTELQGPPHRRFSAIICPTDVPGFRVVRRVPVMGETGGPHGSACEVRLDDVRVPAENLLGERGNGFAIAQSRLGPGRIFHCMRWLGQAQRAFELMCARAQSRWAHGSVLAEKGAVREMIADAAIDIQAARLLTLDAARAIDHGDDARVEIAMVKVFAAQMVHRVVDRAVQVHGALGVSADSPLERMYREARLARIMDGPDEVHRDSLARRLVAQPGSAPWA